MDRVAQIGLLGGTFDPVHRAHIALARAAYEALDLDRVELIPAGHPWQRGDLGASGTQRRTMLELAVGDDPRLRVNPIELDRPGATYTADTLAALPRGPRYTWILGADQLVNFCTWHRWREILQYARLAVAQRPGAALQPPAELAAALAADGLVQIPFASWPISATQVREALAHGEDVSALLDERVLQYIRHHQLYPAATRSLP